MPLPGSGTITLVQIYNEVTNTTHNGSTAISLSSMADLANANDGLFNVTNPDSMSEFYGWVYYSPPTVTTSAATSVTSSSAQLNGTVTSWGSYAPDRYGFYFGTSSTCTSNTRYDWTGSQGVSTFNNVFSGLSESTNYWFCAYAKATTQPEVIGSTLGFSTTAAAVCVEIISAKSGTSGQAACTTATRGFRYDRTTFDAATTVWVGTDTTCAGTPATAGYFSNGVTWRYWSGTAFTSSGTCTN